MRALYIPSDKIWLDYYTGQARQYGGGFVGNIPYQRGAGLGSLFKGLFRAILPLAKSVGKTVGRQALSTGAQIASDVVAGKSLGDSAELRGRAAASKLLKKASRAAKKRQPVKKQRGGGLGVRPAKAKAKTKSPRATTKRKGIKRKKKTTKTRLEDQLGVYYN